MAGWRRSHSRYEWSEHETPSQTFCRHNGIPYRGGCGSLASSKSAAKAKRDAISDAIIKLAQRKIDDA